MCVCEKVLCGQHTPASNSAHTLGEEVWACVQDGCDVSLKYVLYAAGDVAKAGAWGGVRGGDEDRHEVQLPNYLASAHITSTLNARALCCVMLCAVACHAMPCHGVAWRAVLRCAAPLPGHLRWAVSCPHLPAAAAPARSSV